MTDTEELWVVEWSCRQRAIHMQKLKYSLQKARNRFHDDQPPPNDYEALFVGSRAEAEIFAGSIRPELNRRGRWDAQYKGEGK